MVSKKRPWCSSANTFDLLCTFSIPMFVLLIMMIAFQSSEYTLLAKAQTSPFSGMNFSIPVDVYSKKEF